MIEVADPCYKTQGHDLKLLDGLDYAHCLVAAFLVGRHRRVIQACLVFEGSDCQNLLTGCLERRMMVFGGRELSLHEVHDFDVHHSIGSQHSGECRDRWVYCCYGS